MRMFTAVCCLLHVVNQPVHHAPLLASNGDLTVLPCHRTTDGSAGGVVRFSLSAWSRLMLPRWPPSQWAPVSRGKTSPKQRQNQCRHSRRKPCWLTVATLQSSFSRVRRT